MQYVIPSTKEPLEEVLRGVYSLSPGQSCTLGALEGSGPAYLLARSFSENPVTTLAVLSSQEEAEVFCSELRFFLGPGLAFILPTTERLPFEESLIHPEIIATRLKVLYRLTRSEPVIVVTVASNLMERLIPSAALTGSVFRLRTGELHPRDELLKKLFDAGYARTNMVEERGELSVRGDIVDIFAPLGELPVRIEFFDDEIESIKEFDPSSQRSTTQVDELVILPAREVLLSLEARSRARARLVERADDLALERPAYINISGALRDGIFLPSYNAMAALFYDRLDTIFDYLQGNTLITLIEPAQVADEFEVLGRDVRRAVKKKTEDSVFFVEPSSLYLDAGEVKGHLKAFRLLELSGSAIGKGDVNIEGNFDLIRLVADKTRQNPLKALIDRIKKWLDSCACVFISAHNKGQAERTRELLEGYGLIATIGVSTDIISLARSARLNIVVGLIGAGFKTSLLTGETYEDDDLFDICLVSEDEVFGPRIKHRPPKAGKLKNFLSELRDLSQGDGIVHVLHGIAIYRGLNRLEVEGVENDFLVLEYRGKDRLYLPVQRMDQVTKYHGPEGRGVSPDKLGGPGWGKRQAKVKKAVRKIAVELLKLYAEREASEGFAFSPSCHLYSEFCASFEFEETPDQLRSINEVNADMERARPMDRLLCADVGYGKTEVAMRAAFKAVLDGKQVAILVPTTVLAQQHAMTFTERFSAYPVRVDVLSRFRGKAEQGKVIEMAAKGDVDILIGTHRLLGRDISFADLGLVIVDEEHRFGVKHKERLRELKNEVDVLTLTATPIPRTLQMSITDIRALSIISTPPEDRLAIKTVITPFDEGVIKSAIEREMRRAGQVFFVHNRVESISNMATLLNSLVPQARLAVAHGQMNEHELEKKMLGFVKYDYDVLLCTTIIESGLDIARANTIIINRADRFGLAELYQLRGRVGRSNHRAYAYLLSPTGSLSPDARKRLDAIVSLTGPGSGFRVASYDLEIRGAGELLGASQSGHISEVGFDMYTTLLEEAVSELKGERIKTQPAPEVNIRVSAYIPDDYIPDTRQRLGVYKRLSEAGSIDDLVFMAEELEDRYGEIPELVYNLIKMAEIRLDLTALGALELKQLAGKLYITFAGVMQTSAQGTRERVSKKALELTRKDFARYRVTPDGKFVYTMTDADGLKPTDPLAEARYILKEFLE